MMSTIFYISWLLPEFFLSVWNIELMKLLAVTIAKVSHPKPCKWSKDLHNGWLWLQSLSQKI